MNSRRHITAARQRSIIRKLLIEWHPQWLTRAELQALSPLLAKVPGRVIEQQLAEMYRAGSIRVETSGNTQRIYWNEGDDT